MISSEWARVYAKRLKSGEWDANDVLADINALTYTRDNRPISTQSKIKIIMAIQDELESTLQKGGDIKHYLELIEYMLNKVRKENGGGNRG